MAEPDPYLGLAVGVVTTADVYELLVSPARTSAVPSAPAA